MMRFFFMLLFAVFACAQDDLFTAKEKALIAAHPEVRVGVEMDWEPYDYVDEEGKHRGISQDYLDEIERISGLKFTLHPQKQWSTLLKQMKAGKIDLLPALYYSEERSEFMDFTNPYLKLSEYLFTQNDAPRIRAADEMYGKRIGVVKGFEVLSWLKRTHPKVKIVEQNSLFESIQALSLGEIDGFVGDLPSTRYIQEKYFITNVKANAIIFDRDPVNVYMGIRKDYEALGGIINKSLSRISRKQREAIFERYVRSEGNTMGLRGAFGYGRPPFMYEKGSGVGIEVSLINAAFKKQGLMVDEVRQMPSSRAQKVLIEHDEIDFSAGVVEDESDGLYYSDPFVSYDNVAISRRVDQLKITQINDLRNYRVAGWMNATHMLGDTFKAQMMDVSGSGDYKEYMDQAIQHQDFFEGKADVILVDRHVFAWYVRQVQGMDDLNASYVIHPLFESPSILRVSFRNDRLRDEFNRGLQSIKEDGSYERIIEQHLKLNIQKPLNLVKLLAGLLSKDIYENDIEGIKNLLVHFKDAQIIRGVEVISKGASNSLLLMEHKGNGYESVESFSWKDAQEAMLEKASYFQDSGDTLHVGKVKVYFNKDAAEYIHISYIPALEKFSEHEDYERIQALYSNLGLNALRNTFTVEEQQWITEHPRIRFVGDPNWLPYEAFDEQGDYIGIVAEYLSEIEKISGLSFERVVTSSWDESVKKIKAKEADVISETTDSDLRSLLRFSKSYLDNHIVIIMDKEAKYVDQISQLKGQKIALIKNYGYVPKIKRAYRDIEFVEVADISEGLKAVSKGEIDALLCTMALGVYSVNKEGYGGLRIVGKTEFSTKIGFGVQPEMLPLVTVLNKSIDALEEGKKQEILKRWALQKYVEKVDYTLVWQILGVSFVLIALFVYWNRQMRREISRRKVVEAKLQEANDKVRESIEFSSLIQQALIPEAGVYRTLYQDIFTVWKPRDTVGGDIFFIEPLRDEGESLVMMVDCTGHGVPGAFVTMLVKAIERNITGRIINSDEVVSPANILGVFNRSMKHLLKQEDASAKSNAGFDAAVVYLNKKEGIMRYAGAEIPLFYVDAQKQVKTIKADRHSIGYRSSRLDYVFKEHALELAAVESFYLSSDGYLDQNGGEKGFPFGKKRFQALLQEHQGKTMASIEKALLEALKAYQQEEETNDDICVLGVRV